MKTAKIYIILFMLSGTGELTSQPAVKINAEYHIDLSAYSGKIVVDGNIDDITFTKSIFFTSFLQYNTQTGNFNINTRLQWRYAPLSDIFLVYTENYFSDDLKVRNRGAILKWTYWLNK